MHNNIHTHVLMYLRYGFISLFMSVHSCLLVSVNTLIIELGVSQEALKRRSMGIQCEEWPPVHSNKPDCWPAGDKYIQSMLLRTFTFLLASLRHSVKTRNNLTGLTARVSLSFFLKWGNSSLNFYFVAFWHSFLPFVPSKTREGIRPFYSLTKCIQHILLWVWSHVS